MNVANGITVVTPAVLDLSTNRSIRSANLLASASWLAHVTGRSGGGAAGSTAPIRGAAMARLVLRKARGEGKCAMAKADIELRQSDTILDELSQLQRQIRVRAYYLFLDRELAGGDTLSDWLIAERTSVWKPAVELRQKNGQVEVRTALPGVEAKDVDVQVTSEDVLIKTVVNHEHTERDGTVHVCEFQSGTAFRSIHLPVKIDPDSVKAEYRNGMLRLTAAVAKAAMPEVDVKAAEQSQESRNS
jgi:HSP20 family molecular chaperone IbpA